MAPKTAAERQKEYRERLKTQNPEKLKALKKKDAERSLAYYRNKIKHLTVEQKRELLEEKSKKKLNQAERIVKNQRDEDNDKERKLQRRIEVKLKKKTQQLRNNIQKLWRGFKSLEKRCGRQQTKMDELHNACDVQLKKIEKLEATCDVQQKTIDGLQATSANAVTDPQPTAAAPNIEIMTPCEYTPLKKAEHLIIENFNDVKTPQKELIKKTLLEHNVLKESLKDKFASSSNQIKNTLKEIIDNKLVRKYKLKTSLTQSLGLNNNFKRYKNTKQKRNYMINKIQEFYLRDDVSRATAGKKEYKTLHKVKMQKRYLLEKLKTLHKKYVNEAGSVSFSTFKKYRPFYVVRPNIKDLESCACIKHSNMQFMATKLKSIGLIDTDNLDEVISTLVCDKHFKTCMYSDCNACAYKLIEGNVNLPEKLKWKAWALLNHEFGEPGGNTKKTKKMRKIEKEGSAQDLIATFNKDLANFKIHVYNIRHQYLQYKYCVQNLNDNEVLIHIDFSENWTGKYFQEVQAMHFGASKTQMTLHTGVYYVKGNTHPVSFCSISPDNRHNPEAIWAHLWPILQEIKSMYPHINLIHFYSDGPSTQYRQKKNFYLFSKNIFEYGFSFGTWSFFEASHGKGAADGIGGAIKRTLDSKVAQGNDIPDAEKAFDILKSSETSIRVFYIPAEKIQTLEPDNGTRIIPLKKTMKVHQLITEEKFIVKHREVSCFCQNLNGRCDCHAPITHSFQQNEGSADEILVSRYILDEITGDIQIINETNESEHTPDAQFFTDDEDLLGYDANYAVYNEDCFRSTIPIEIQDYERNNNLRHQKKHDPKKVRYAETDEEDSYSVHDSTDVSIDLEDTLQDSIDEISELEDIDNETECSQLRVYVDSYILVKFILEKRIKYYLGQVLEITGKNNYRVKFLRNKGNGKFAWPITDDISLVFKDDVESILPNPISERRGIKTFDIFKLNFKIE